MIRKIDEVELQRQKIVSSFNNSIREESEKEESVRSEGDSVEEDSYYVSDDK